MPGIPAIGGESHAAPVRRQYLQIKQRFPDTILLFRLGDFYETFEHDAEQAAAVLDIVLTSRDLGKGVRVPMAGIPHHAADTYIARLVAAGHKVAICEQIGTAQKGRALIDRDVTKVITPGTVTDPSMLDGHRNTYIAAIAVQGQRWGLAYADLSTGEFAATQATQATADQVPGAVQRELLRLNAVEVVISPELVIASDASASGEWLPPGIATSTLERHCWQPRYATEALRRHFAVETLDGFGLSDLPLATQAAGALLAYLGDTQRSSLAQVSAIRTYSTDGFMVLDAQARRNLELVESGRGERRHGLLAVLDQTRTPMGARLLRRWLNQPLLDRAAIEMRQARVQQLLGATLARAEVREALGDIGDIERLVNRAITKAISPRELATLRISLLTLSTLARLLPDSDTFSLPPEVLSSATALGATLDRALRDELPAAIGGGVTIRPGFSPELDEHEHAVQEARSWIANLERQERERTGIRTLKVGYNRVSGYFIEVTANALLASDRDTSRNGDARGIPDDYAIRQSLANSTRYVTAQLKECEARIVSAQDVLTQLEADVYQRLVAEVASHASSLLIAASVVAELDVVSTLAEVAATRQYIRPVVDESTTIEIRGGRHPTLETLLPIGEFIGNDALLDAESRAITILTGPNMAGKSSWLRQVGLIVLLAQIGSFVPADSARIGLVDRIFSRIGAQDDIATGQSTFMVEMVETANILHHATARSLVLLDEIGRGTSTWDGMAIARAIVEHLHNAPHLGCRTLFATHYHELTALAEYLPGVCCARMDVLEEGDRVVFLHRVVEGAADRSYGVHVAELAGLPRALTRRAREILRDLEDHPTAAVVRDRRGRVASKQDTPAAMQLTLFSPPSPVETTIRELEIDALSPLEAINVLYKLRQLALGGADTSGSDA